MEVFKFQYAIEILQQKIKQLEKAEAEKTTEIDTYVYDIGELEETVKFLKATQDIIRIMSS